MDKVISVNGVPVHLNAERWVHIVTGHPEMADCYVDLLQTVESPEIIYEGSRGELLAVRSRNDSSDKKIIVVYKEISADDGFVITAYLSNKLSELEKRVIAWQRPN